MTELKRASWGSKMGMMLAAAGSSVGLGNLWRFPYVAAENGGGAFLLSYIICTVFVGLPIVFGETALGVRAKSDPVGAFASIRKGFKFIGWISILICTVIVPYYSVVGGWIVAYLFNSFSVTDIQNYETHFSTFIASPVMPACFFWIYLLAGAGIVFGGIERGIEKFCKLMMPMLFILLLVLMVRVLTLPNAIDGVKFFFLPDFSKISGQTFLDALGQVFFSVSVGMGIYITYGSYVQDKEIDIAKTMTPVISLDLLVSLLTGLTIFPAVFAFGLPMNAGPALTFITLPKIFAGIPFGTFFGFVFFAILLGAATTSSISLMEVVITFMCDQLKMARRKAVLLFTFYSLTVGTVVSLSFGKLSGFKIGGKILFDQMDYLASDILLPISGFLTCLALGQLPAVDRLKVSNNRFIQKSFDICIKWVSPLCVLSVLLHVVGLL